MVEMSDRSTIHLIWEGPLTVETAKSANSGSDKGVYQIYGTHIISGPDTLLYVGRRAGRARGELLV